MYSRKSNYFFSAILILFTLLSSAGTVSGMQFSKKERAYLNEKETIVFVSQTRYPPFEFVDKNGQHTGMCIELARWMATELGFTARFVNSSFQQAQKAVLSGKADVITSLFYSKKRAESFNFTQVMFEVPASIFVLAQRTDIRNLNNLDGKTVAMQSGDYAKEYLESKNISAHVVYTKDFADAIDLVIAGKADAVIGDEQIVLYHIFKNKLTKKIKRVGEPLYIGQNCMATKKNNQVLIDILKKGIKLAKKNGIFEKINRKWIGTRYALQESRLSRYLPHILVSVGVVFILLLLVWFWNIRLRHVVNERTNALEISEEQYKTLMDNLPVAVFRNTPGPVGEFLMANAAFCKIFGFENEEEVKQYSPADLYPNPEERKEYSNLLIKKGLIKNYEWTLVKRDKTPIHTSITSRVVNGEDGNVSYFDSILIDITDRKKLETELQHAQKMEAIGTLAGRVAHDLNNILSGLVSYPELLLLQLPEDSPLREPIQTIQKSGEKAAAVVQDLLTLARRNVVITEVLNLNDVIREYLKSPEHEKMLSFHPGVHLATHLEKEILDILGSPTHLSTSVMNLVSNASEAMPHGGEITIKTENKYVDRPIKGHDHVREGDYVVLTVSDTGTGISPDDMQKIFEPFYTKKKMGRSGTGLGMAVVWGTVKDHNGYIDVKSTEGKGTTFSLYFPVTRKKAPKETPHLTVGSCRGNGESILIVDDVKAQREIASSMLRELGYSVESVSSGEEAVLYLKTHTVDLLLLDMIMDPGMNGLQTYKKIIEIHPGQKAVIASGFSENDSVKEVQRLGAGAYVKKPFRLEKIGLALREELRPDTARG